jgi:flagellar biogenesis protein FliO
LKFRKRKHHFNIDAKYFKRVVLFFLIFILLFILFMTWFLDQFFEGNRESCYKQETKYNTILTANENHKKALETCNINDK